MYDVTNMGRSSSHVYKRVYNERECVRWVTLKPIMGICGQLWPYCAVGPEPAGAQ